MPKTRRRKKEAGRGVINHARTHAPTSQTRSVESMPTTRATSSNRPILSPGVRGPQSLILPGMVALGCWGMAFSFIVLTTESNHILFGGMAVLMALLWTFSFGVRLRKLLLL